MINQTVKVRCSVNEINARTRGPDKPLSIKFTSSMSFDESCTETEGFQSYVTLIRTGDIYRTRRNDQARGTEH